jgi:hypothetical protein
MNEADFNFILAQRKVLFGGGPASIPCVMAVEEFGDDSEEDKDMAKSRMIEVCNFIE